MPRVHSPSVQAHHGASLEFCARHDGSDSDVYNVVAGRSAAGATLPANHDHHVRLQSLGKILGRAA